MYTIHTNITQIDDLKKHSVSVAIKENKWSDLNLKCKNEIKNKKFQIKYKNQSLKAKIAEKLHTWVFSLHKRVDSPHTD